MHLPEVELTSIRTITSHVHHMRATILLSITPLKSLTLTQTALKVHRSCSRGHGYSKYDHAYVIHTVMTELEVE